ncbi:MAG TPA: DUF1175 family protein, partial [Bdellovibrio sp.]|nr:DUF1175 family protein [Bdellovibrio sp.]
MILKKFFYFTSLLFILMTAACAHQVVDSSSSSTWNAEEKESARIHLTRLALEQSQSFSNKWEPSQRDCAGFVRFLYREAVTGRANMWTNKEHQTVSFVSARELIAYNFSQVNSG